MQHNNGRAFNPPVTVRAWGDEPVKLFLYAIENNRCSVGTLNGKRTLSLPANQVFCFDVDGFALLSTAFQQRDMRKLGELWANISVDDLACNKYQDVIDSPHDQENIADTKRSANGHNE